MPKKVCLPESLKPLAEEAKKFKNEQEFTNYTYGNSWPTTRNDVKVMEKFTGHSYGSRYEQKPTIDALKDFYKIITGGKTCASR